MEAGNLPPRAGQRAGARLACPEKYTARQHAIIRTLQLQLARAGDDRVLVAQLNRAILRVARSANDGNAGTPGAFADQLHFHFEPVGGGGGGAAAAELHHVWIAPDPLPAGGIQPPAAPRPMHPEPQQSPPPGLAQPPPPPSPPPPPVPPARPPLPPPPQQQRGQREEKLQERSRQERSRVMHVERLRSAHQPPAAPTKFDITRLSRLLAAPHADEATDPVDGAQRLGCDARIMPRWRDVREVEGNEKTGQGQRGGGTSATPAAAAAAAGAARDRKLPAWAEWNPTASQLRTVNPHPRLLPMPAPPPQPQPLYTDELELQEFDDEEEVVDSDPGEQGEETEDQQEQTATATAAQGQQLEWLRALHKPAAPMPIPHSPPPPPSAQLLLRAMETMNFADDPNEGPRSLDAASSAGGAGAGGTRGLEVPVEAEVAAGPEAQMAAGATAVAAASTSTQIDYGHGRVAATTAAVGEARRDHAEGAEESLRRFTFSETIPLGQHGYWRLGNGV